MTDKCVWSAVTAPRGWSSLGHNPMMQSDCGHFSLNPGKGWNCPYCGKPIEIKRTDNKEK